MNPTFETNDKGETLAYIWIGDNKELKNFNALLLKEGLGVTERQKNITQSLLNHHRTGLTTL
ncbi:hypothetical protein [Bacillus smithii]|uniref:hypothetical protein n=1 Tax=Bacillus smithii TaxID=1479 RepID=UPI00399C9051